MLKKGTIVLVALSLALGLMVGGVMAESWENIDLGYYNLETFENMTGSKITEFDESPLLKEKVSAGTLPPVAERLPDNPLVEIPWESIGEYGGTLHHTAINIDQDWKLRHVNNVYPIQIAPNAGIDLHGTIGVPAELKQPGIFESWNMSADGKVFTATIRKGLKWSDGEPVTTEDVAFRVNDVMRNEEVYPVIPEWLTWGGSDTELEIVNNYTFKLKFAKTYGAFVDKVVMAWYNSWYYLISPSHFMKEYHVNYADKEELLTVMKNAEYQTIEEWGTFYSEVLTSAYGIDSVTTPRASGINIDEPFPTLDPYVVVKDLGEGKFLLERNPYFHIVDPAGNQLPYIDSIRRDYAENMELVNMNIISGNTDLQGYSTRIQDYPLLIENQDKGNYNLLPTPAFVDQLLIYPISFVNEDKKLEEYLRNANFRRALSLALDRENYKESIFMGFGKPANISPRPETPFFEESMMTKYADYDPERARELLEQEGLVDKDGDGWRDYEDGSQFILPFDYFTITGSSSVGAELAKRYWEDIGIKVKLRQVDTGYFFQLRENRKFAVTTWWLGGSGQYHPANWNWLLFPSEWQQWFNTDGEKGEEPFEIVKELQRAREKLMDAVTNEGRFDALREIWNINADNQFIIGTVYGVPQPFVYSKDLSNISIAEEKGFTNVTILDNAHQWYFHNPDRRK